MKTEIKFNHEAETVTESFGITKSPIEMADTMTNAVRSWIEECGALTKSQLAECLIEHLSYAEIVFLATSAAASAAASAAEWAAEWAAMAAEQEKQIVIFKKYCN